MRDFIYSLMTDRRKGALFAPLKFILYLASLCYGAGISGRQFFYRAGIFKTAKAPLKIISVGNLTLGGTGKTPFVITLAKILKDDLGKETSVLIRGYGWDEQAMLKKNLSDIPILVGENRVRSAKRTIRLYGSEAAILDDGFQHWELQRDLDIVLVDSRNPFGNGRLFPRGILREPKEAVRRSDIIVFTKTDKRLFEPEAMKGSFREIKSSLIFLEAMHKPKCLCDEKARMRDFAALRGKRVALLSSIGDPAYFEEMALGLGVKVACHIAFGDHHNYTEADVVRIMKALSERSFDFILTTEKDAVKLDRMNLAFGKYVLMTLVVEMEITEGKELLIDRLHSLFIR